MNATGKNPEFAKWLAEWLGHGRETGEQLGNIPDDGTNTTEKDARTPVNQEDSDENKSKAA